MSTTNLFVELIVIGVGALIWVVLLILTLFGLNWLPYDALISPIYAIPLLAIIYVLGIISDRVADYVFSLLWTDDLRGSYFKDRKEYYHNRRIILVNSERLSDLLEYGRSRLRISRGWAFNLILVLISCNAFLWIHLYAMENILYVSILSSIILLLLIFASWFSWRSLVLNEYRKIKEQAQFIQSVQVNNKS
jgi:hypothetical protein